MKIRNILFTPILFIVMISGLFSCGVDRWPEYAEETELDIWIDSVMRQEYLWYTQPIFSGSRRIPQESDLYYSRQKLFLYRHTE